MNLETHPFIVLLRTNRFTRPFLEEHTFPRSSQFALFYLFFWAFVGITDEAAARMGFGFWRWVNVAFVSVFVLANVVLLLMLLGFILAFCAAALRGRARRLPRPPILDNLPGALFVAWGVAYVLGVPSVALSRTVLAGWGALALYGCILALGAGFRNWKADRRS